MANLILLIFGCVVKIIQPTPIQPEHYEIIHQPPPERVIVKKVIVRKARKTVIIRNKRPKKRLKPEKHRPRPKKRPKKRPKVKKKKRPKNDLPKDREMRYIKNTNKGVHNDF